MHKLEIHNTVFNVEVEADHEVAFDNAIISSLLRAVRNALPHIPITQIEIEKSGEEWDYTIAASPRVWKHVIRYEPTVAITFDQVVGYWSFEELALLRPIVDIVTPILKTWNVQNIEVIVL